MPQREVPSMELGDVPEVPSVVASPSPSEVSSASSPEPHDIRATPLFRALAMPPPEPEQPPGQDELERRLPGYRRIVIPRELTLIELLKQYSGVTTDDEVLQIRETKLRVVAERVGLRRLHVLAPRLRSLTLDGSAIASLRDLGIGLVHLKFLSVNRCGLTSLDGVWGFGALRELHAAGNRLQDLQPLGALQKLHTLNLANNAMSDSSRLWTLGVCRSLRRLTLQGSLAAESPHYRSRIAALLPMLIYLDDQPLHTDIEFDAEVAADDCSSSSDSEDNASGADPGPGSKPSVSTAEPSHPMEPTPGPSNANLSQSIPPSYKEHTLQVSGLYDQWFRLCVDPSVIQDKAGPCDEGCGRSSVHARHSRRRPATTECGGARPARVALPPRPKTAQERTDTSTNTISRLHIMNTLMDEEWLCGGSELTSHGAVCGNLARALRRRPSTAHRRGWEAELELVEQTVQNASRALASEIPRVPCVADWAEFRLKTGIEIDIDFNERPKGDPSRAIERLEQIERETQERFRQEAARPSDAASDASSTREASSASLGPTAVTSVSCRLWREMDDLTISGQ